MQLCDVLGRLAADPRRGAWSGIPKPGGWGSQCTHLVLAELASHGLVSCPHLTPSVVPTSAHLQVHQPPAAR
jgi:hypothetical protein